MPAPDDIQQASDLINGIATLFSAVRSGDTDATGTAADSLQTMLDNLAASSPSASADDGTDATGDTSQDPTQSTFISDLQGLLDALKTGNTSDSKLWTVLTAYKEEQTAAV
jgi:hypothetical protein